MIKTDLKLSISAMRKFNHLFKDKEKKRILDEALYFSNIYKTICIEDLITFSINKYLKVKIHNITLCDIKKDVAEYKEILMKGYKKLR
jgi:hypothetical protein